MPYVTNSPREVLKHPVASHWRQFPKLRIYVNVTISQQTDRCVLGPSHLQDRLVGRGGQRQRRGIPAYYFPGRQARSPLNDPADLTKSLRVICFLRRFPLVYSSTVSSKGFDVVSRSTSCPPGFARTETDLLSSDKTDEESDRSVSEITCL